MAPVALSYLETALPRHPVGKTDLLFVSEAMNILFAEDLTLGEATPEEDEKIEIYMTPLSEVMQMIHAGKIEDGKTLIGVLLYASTRQKA